MNMTVEEWKNYVKEAIEECALEFGNVKTVATIRHIDQSTLSKWRRGTTVPKVDTFLRVFPEYNFEGIDQCNFETRGTNTKCDRPKAEPKKVKAPKPVEEPKKRVSVCVACVHAPICRYKEAFEKTNDALMDNFEEAAKGMPFAHVYMVCDHFMDKDDAPVVLKD